MLDQRAVYETVTHVVELVAQQPEDQRNTRGFDGILVNRSGQRRRDQHRCVGAKHLDDDRIERDPAVDEAKNDCIDGEGQGRSDASAP